MADEKKPVDGTEEQADEAKTPETELTPETTSDAVVTEEDDAAITSDAEDRERQETSGAAPDGETGDGAPADAAASDDAELTDVVFVDRQRGWAIGDRGVIWFSSDGGHSWQLQTAPCRCRLEAIQFSCALLPKRFFDCL